MAAQDDTKSVDLAITDINTIHLYKSEAEEHDVLVIQVIIANFGKQTSPAVRVLFGTWWTEMSQTLPPMKPYPSDLHTLTFEVEIPAEYLGQTVLFSFEIDPEGSYSDLDRSNNVYREQFEILIPAIDTPPSPEITLTPLPASTVTTGATSPRNNLPLLVLGLLALLFLGVVAVGIGIAATSKRPPTKDSSPQEKDRKDECMEGSPPRVEEIELEFTSGPWEIDSMYLMALDADHNEIEFSLNEEKINDLEQICLFLRNDSTINVVHRQRILYMFIDMLVSETRRIFDLIHSDQVHLKVRLTGGEAEIELTTSVCQCTPKGCDWIEIGKIRLTVDYILRRSTSWSTKVDRIQIEESFSQLIKQLHDLL